MKPIIRNTIIFAVIGVIAGYVTALYQTQTLDQASLDEMVEIYGSIQTLHLLTAVQTMIYGALFGFLGQILIRKTSFTMLSLWSKKLTITVLLIGLFSAAFIVLSDALVFVHLFEETSESYQISILYVISGLLYGGIIEEVMLRLFFLTLLVVLIKWITKKEMTTTTIWIAIILSAFLFAVGHLPAAVMLLGNGAAVISRTLLLNAVPGILFGYLYTKHGLTSSIAAHMVTHIFMQLVFLPLFF